MSQQKEEKTALDWLLRDYPDSPKKRLKDWFKQGRVSLNGRVVTKPHLRMEDPGDRLQLGKSAPASRVLTKRMPIRLHAQVNLLYIDESLAIINKGAGLLSVPLEGKESPSALKILSQYLQSGSSDTLMPLPVHRLDKYTSGLLCFAMNTDAREHLVRQVREHSFIREYLALADGRPEPRKGTWRSWFKLDADGMEQTVYDEPTEGAAEATTYYDVLDTIEWPAGKGTTHYVSRLRLRLKSGLKHQLRIHAARAGVPLLGDRSYHPDFKRAAETGAGAPHGCKRQALHASSIGFVHPDSGETKRFSCKFPRDLAELEQSLRAKQVDSPRA